MLLLLSTCISTDCEPDSFIFLHVINLLSFQQFDSFTSYLNLSMQYTRKGGIFWELLFWVWLEYKKSNNSWTILCVESELKKMKNLESFDAFFASSEEITLFSPPNLILLLSFSSFQVGKMSVTF